MISNIREAKVGSSELFDLLEKGEAVIVCRRNKPMARVVVRRVFEPLPPSDRAGSEPRIPDLLIA